jgi:hypothetical protein
MLLLTTCLLLPSLLRLLPALLLVLRLLPLLLLVPGLLTLPPVALATPPPTSTPATSTPVLVIPAATPTSALTPAPTPSCLLQPQLIGCICAAVLWGQCVTECPDSLQLLLGRPPCCRTVKLPLMNLDLQSHHGCAQDELWNNIYRRR